MVLIMVRHAQSVDNFRGVHLHRDDPLSDTGWRQAGLLARRLQNLRIDYVYISGSRRVLQTLAPIRRVRPEIPVIDDDRLTEGSIGAWRGVPLSIRNDIARETGQAIWQIRPPGGESYEDIDRRIKTILPQLARLSEAATVLLVGHGRTNSLIIRRLAKMPWEAFDARRQAHTSVTRIHFAEGSCAIDLKNDVSHLTPDLITL